MKKQNVWTLELRGCWHEVTKNCGPVTSLHAGRSSKTPAEYGFAVRLKDGESNNMLALDGLCFAEKNNGLISMESAVIGCNAGGGT